MSGYLPSELCSVINEDRSLESMRHQINHIHDYNRGACGCKPRGNEIELQRAYFAATGRWWDPYEGMSTDWKPSCIELDDATCTCPEGELGPLDTNCRFHMMED